MTNQDQQSGATRAIYRGMDRATLDAAYDNASAVADRADFLARWRKKSAEMRASSGAKLDIAYGIRERTRLDYFPSGAKQAPLFVFIHGGYWQRNEKETFAFVAEGPLARGIDVALVGYTLAPEARLTEIVGEIGQSLTFLGEHSSDFGFDRRAMFVGGWSAGGHLTAAVSAHPLFRGGIPISGIYDLEPIALGELNDKLGLDQTEIDTMSPLNTLSNESPPLRLAVGGSELPELKRQSEIFAEAAQARGLPVRLAVLPGHHHFSILDEIVNPEGALTRDLVDLISATK